MNWECGCGSGEEAGQGFGGGAEDDFIEGFEVEGFFGAYVDGADAALVGDVDEAGSGIDGAGGADDEEGGGAVEFAVDGVHVEGDLAEPDDVRADRSGAGFAGREVSGFVEGVVGEGLVAARAAGLEERAVHMMDAVGAGALVEIVYVLGTEVEVLRVCFGEALLNLGEGLMGGVGLGSEGVTAALGVEAPD